MGLRCPKVLEAQASDKAVWSSMSDLMNDHRWSLDECLNEFTNVRSDLAVLLQPQPCAVKPPLVPSVIRPSSKGSKGNGKSKGKLTKGGKGKQTWVSEFQQNGEWKQIWMKYQSDRCELDSCGLRTYVLILVQTAPPAQGPTLRIINLPPLTNDDSYGR